MTNDNQPVIAGPNPDILDTSAPVPTLADGAPDDDAQNNLVVRGRDGDPLPDPKSVEMRERESYERVIEGLKIAADAAKHLARREPQRLSMWMVMSTKLDQARKIAVQKAGIEFDGKVRESGDVRGEGLDWTDARNRFRFGLKQAEGGCRQLAVVHRGDYEWTKMAMSLHDLHQKVRRPPVLRPDPASKLILPAQYNG